MPEKFFIAISYITFGLSVIPFILLIFLKFLSRKVNVIIGLVSLTEFITGISNFIFYQFVEESNLIQFQIYYTIEISCWIFIILRFYINQVRYIHLISLAVVFLFFVINFENNILLEVCSKLLQLYLAAVIILKFLADDEKPLQKEVFYFSIGILIYSFTCVNILLFKNLTKDIEMSSYYVYWLSHQFAAIIYFSLLSISIWKSQKI